MLFQKLLSVSCFDLSFTYFYLVSTKFKFFVENHWLDIGFCKRRIISTQTFECQNNTHCRLSENGWRLRGATAIRLRSSFAELPGQYGIISPLPAIFKQSLHKHTKVFEKLFPPASSPYAFWLKSRFFTFGSRILNVVPTPISDDCTAILPRWYSFTMRCTSDKPSPQPRSLVV